MRRSGWMVLALAVVSASLSQVAAIGQQPAAGRASEPKAASPAAIRVSFDPAVQSGAYSGRVYVVLAKGAVEEPRLSIGDWFNPPEVVARDVKDVGVGSAVAFEGATLAYPKAMTEIAPGRYTAQAIARRSLDCPVPGQGAGDLYSKPVEIDYPPKEGAGVDLKLTEVVPARPFKETARVKLVEIRSEALSKFHGREMKIRAGVALPGDWTDDPADVRPVIYFIGGFGGDHTQAKGVASMFQRAPEGASGAKLPIVVVPDATCGYGHSVFADSDTNGPWGRALVEELIPAVDARFHGAGAAKRYVTGISSGGWACLWLQVAYPDAFAGCWSHCPDPVDFRDFQRIDIYAPNANMYTDERGKRRPLARANGGEHERVLLWYDDFCRMERVLGRGGQIGSFEAVFSGRGADGEPRPLFDRDTGKIDPATAKAWERYDIRLVLERNWAELGPKLKGKLHIYAGEVDTFYLEGAVVKLKDTLEKLGSDAEVEIVPGMPHSMHREGIEAMVRTVSENARR